MKKNLLILFTLILVLSIALSITATCFAEEIPIATEIDLNETEVVAQPFVEEQPQEAEIATADNDAWTWLKETWEKVKPYCMGAFSGLTIGGLVSAIFYAVIKSLTTKTLNKIDNATSSSAIADLTTKKLEEHFAKTTIDVDIKPLMEKQYLILANNVFDTLNKSTQKQDEKYLAMVNVFEKLSHYYDGSIGVTDAQKQELADAVAYAKSLFVEPTKTTAKIAAVAEPIIKEETKETKAKARNY